jgi:hypothetical protein
MILYFSYDYQVLECFRRLVFSVAIGFIFQGSGVNSVLMAIAFSLACLYVYVKWSPFCESEVAGLSVVVSYSLTFLFFVALIIKAQIQFGNDVYASILIVTFAAPLLYTIACILLKHSLVITFMSKLYEVKAQNRKEQSQTNDSKDLFSTFHVIDDSDTFLMCENSLIQNDLFMDFEKTVEFDRFLLFHSTSSRGDSITSFQEPAAADGFLVFDTNPSAEILNRKPFSWNVSTPSTLESFLTSPTMPSAAENKPSPAQDSIVNSFHNFLLQFDILTKT